MRLLDALYLGRYLTYLSQKTALQLRAGKLALWPGTYLPSYLSVSDAMQCTSKPTWTPTDWPQISIGLTNEFIPLLLELHNLNSQ